jgi:hypothetical protein
LAIPAFAGVLVPEAAVDEDHLTAAREYEVGFARGVGAMEPISVAEAMNQSANDHLGRGVGRFDGPHDVGPVVQRLPPGPFDFTCVRSREARDGTLSDV